MRCPQIKSALPANTKPPQRPLDPNPQRGCLVADEQLRMVLSHTRGGVVVATAFAVLMAIYVHGSISRQWVLGWIVAKLLVATCRIVLAQRYANLGHPGGIGWRKITYSLLAVDGIVWGFAGFGMMSQPLPTASLIAAAAACVTCVATFGLQARFIATGAYVVPILVPTAAGLMLRGDDFGLFGGLGLLMLLGLQLFTANATQERFAAAILLRLQAQTLAAEKDAALQLAKRQSAVKAQFLANISHELRTPLHGILGLARLLHLESRDTGVRHRLELIEASGAHLLGLINDLLDVSRIESGYFSIRRERFDLVSQAGLVADVSALRARDKGLTLTLSNEFERPSWVVGDAARFRQVLHNLLGNAIKFTQRGSVELKLARGSEPGIVCVEVSDSGPGISNDAQEQIFQPFHQGNGNGSTMISGAGLGLTIAREIANAMGGDITVRSQIGVGSTFVFTALLPALPVELPLSESSAKVPETATIDHVGLRHVLVAEDDDVNAIVLGAYLEQAGVDFERVINGKEAARHALRETERPDLILMDRNMPVMDGLAATREIRAQERTLGLHRVPVIALTATATDEDRQQCIAAGMDDFLSKPFTREELVQVLRLWSGAATTGAIAELSGVAKQI